MEASSESEKGSNEALGIAQGEVPHLQVFQVYIGQITKKLSAKGGFASLTRTRNQ